MLPAVSTTGALARTAMTGCAVTPGALLARATGHASHGGGGTSSAGEDAGRHAPGDTGAIRAALAPLLAANLEAALRSPPEEGPADAALDADKKVHASLRKLHAAALSGTLRDITKALDAADQTLAARGNVLFRFR